MNSTRHFARDFFEKYTTNLGNYYRDNFDKEVLKKRPFRNELYSWLSYVSYKCTGIDLFYIPRAHVISDFEPLYLLLSDVESKKMLLAILCYRLLGYRRVKLPRSTSAYWATMLGIQSAKTECIPIYPKNTSEALHIYDLQFLGVPIRVYSIPFGVYTLFVAKQYQYRGADEVVQCAEGDYVIDAGACWGETALSFSLQVGTTGRVFAFEFIPDNLTILKKNLGLNPELGGIVKVIPSPLWDIPGRELNFDEGGCSSRLLPEGCYGAKVLTTSLDEFVKENGIEHIDFIKMDIEGSELAALKGAANVLRAFRPKLAIALYHKAEDFRTIPEFIYGLDLGYRFYLDHHSINVCETILYASAR